jgi:hypothetical protein
MDKTYRNKKYWPKTGRLQNVLATKRVGDKSYLQTKHISGDNVLADKKYQKTPSQSVSSADRMHLGRQKCYHHQSQYVGRNRIVNGGQNSNCTSRTISRGLDGLMYFFKAEFPSKPVFFQFRFNLQTAEIQTAIGVQADSKRRAIGFKTADQKIAKLFRLRLIPLHSSIDI